jgi:hypothetical protein
LDGTGNTSTAKETPHNNKAQKIMRRTRKKEKKMHRTMQMKHEK